MIVDCAFFVCAHHVAYDHSHLTFFFRRFESEELKMLRVAVSSFYDYLAVVLKTMQEFDRTMMMMGSDETTIR